MTQAPAELDTRFGGPTIKELRLAAYGVATLMPTPPTTLLAFDPGGHTGWCEATFDPVSGEVSWSSVFFGQYGPRQHYQDIGHHIENLVNSKPHLMVVTEDYVPEFARAQNYVALEYIGVMEYICRDNLVPFVRQSRQIKTFWTRQKMQAVGMWPIGMPHAQDAARHWLAYACQEFPTVKKNILTRLK